jgi:hypothetical protein
MKEKQKYITKEPYKGLVTLYLNEPVKQELPKEVPKELTTKPNRIEKYLLNIWIKQFNNKTLQEINLPKLYKLANKYQQSTNLIEKIGTELDKRGINKTFIRTH